MSNTERIHALEMRTWALLAIDAVIAIILACIIFLRP